MLTIPALGRLTVGLPLVRGQPGQKCEPLSQREKKKKRKKKHLAVSSKEKHRDMKKQIFGKFRQKWLYPGDIQPFDFVIHCCLQSLSSRLTKFITDESHTDNLGVLSKLTILCWAAFLVLGHPVLWKYLRSQLVEANSRALLSPYA